MGILNLLLSLLTFIALVTSAILFYRQMSSNHEWNRRRTAHDLIFQSYIGHFSELRAKLEHKINIYDEAEDYNKKKSELDDRDHKILNSILNFLDNVCLAIKNNVVTEEIIFDCLAGILIAYSRWAKPYIQTKRAINPRVWIEIDPYVKDWEKKKKEILDGMVKEGKRKL